MGLLGGSKSQEKYLVETFTVNAGGKSDIKETATLYQKVADYANKHDLDVVDISLKDDRLAGAIIGITALFKRVN